MAIERTHAAAAIPMSPAAEKANDLELRYPCRGSRDTLMNTTEYTASHVHSHRNTAGRGRTTRAAAHAASITAADAISQAAIIHKSEVQPDARCPNHHSTAPRTAPARE